MNLEHYLTEHHQGTRRQIVRLLRQERVTVNDAVVVTGHTAVTATDCICVDGLAVTGRQPQYLVFNRPLGFQDDLTPTTPRSLGGLLNEFDRQWQLTALADLPKEATGLVLASDDAHFLTDLQRIGWASQLTAQLTGPVAPDLSALKAAVTWQALTVTPDAVHQTTTIVGTTKGVAAAVIALSQLPGLIGPVTRTGVGPLTLPGDLPVGTYRGLFAPEIDALVAPLDATTPAPK
ncbi:16S rRNA pseudouridylate synthase [Levilactobacillus zymae]|uniref:Ribosomal small subunit pseudouridine synthase A n=1 Tax=Levilactobacillus zymae TaxID=267363 RepID=A0A1Y6JX81_9LACO|nr:16S rRNA pseudouridylate synthase [Levilactobacillus zymae]SMS14539.1 Ribosomal small subunit pseudouridine synthase A [Levilactobacillus zymae]